MGAWFIDKVLPGVVTGVIMSAGVWLSHRRLRAAQDERILAVLTEITLNTQLTEDVKKAVAPGASQGEP